MSLSTNEVRARAAEFAREWKDATYESGEKQSFYDAFFNVFGMKRRQVATFEEPVKKLGGKQGFIDLLWKGNRQSDLFASHLATQTYRPDPEKVRARLHNLLAEAREAKVIPWSRPVLTLYKTIFPEMSQHLPDDEAKQLCFEFETELARLEAA